MYHNVEDKSRDVKILKFCDIPEVREVMDQVCTFFENGIGIFSGSVIEKSVLLLLKPFICVSVEFPEIVVEI